MTKRPVKEELQRVLPGPEVLAALFVVAAAFVWFYWSSMMRLTHIWWANDDYQHGFFVPLFAIVLLWLRRDMIVPFAGRGSWWGLAPLALWAMMLWVAVYFNYQWLPEMSILPFFAGMALFVAGWQGLRWAWPAIVFLFFMIPLPGAVQGAASQQLQGLASRLSLFVIQTLGMRAVPEGHLIHIGDAPKALNVAEACSGLRMMMLFFAICIGAAFVVRRPLWEKIVMVLSAPLIAVAANVVRIVLTAVLTNSPLLVKCLVAVGSLFTTVKDPDDFIHKCVGVALMMPVGLLLLWAEMTLLSKLLVAPAPERPLMVGQIPGRRSRP
jgi:exosortase